MKSKLQHYQKHQSQYEFMLVFSYFAINANILATSVIMEAYRRSDILPFEVWQPFVWEYTSAISILLLIPALNWLIKVVALNGKQIRKTFAVYLMASVIFSSFHISMMVGLRKFIYWVQDLTYTFGDLSFELLYEYRKDLFAFIFIIIAIKSYQFTLSRILGEANLIADGENNVLPTNCERLLIKKLGKEFIIKIRDVEWLESSGNYVNLHIKGRIYPTRSTISQLIEKISDKGFCRVHRSYGVNLNMINSIEPLSSGDSEIKLIDGKILKLSRRYKEQLKINLN